MAFRLLLLLLLIQPAIAAAQTCVAPEILIAPAEWSLQSGRVPIVVSNKNADVRDLILEAAFVDANTRYGLDRGKLQLCADADNPCQGTVKIPPNSAATVYMGDAGRISAGIYDGRIVARYLGPPECGVSPVTTMRLYSSSAWHGFAGIVVVIASAFLAWWVKTYASNRVTRAQALLPIALLSERLNALDSALEKVNVQLGTRTPKLSGAAADLMKQLAVTTLEVKYGLPGKTPSPFSVRGISTEFTTFVSQSDSIVTLLTIFVKEGLEPVVELTASGQIPSPKAAEAIVAIDGLFDPVLKREDARKGIQEAIEKARTPGPSPSPESVSRAVAPLSFDRLRVEIRSLNIVGWFVILGVAAISTIYQFVLKPGFGRPSDYLVCVITSFGLPVVISTLMPSRASVTAITDASQPVSGSPGTT
jgi:hypothetical protein